MAAPRKTSHTAGRPSPVNRGHKKRHQVPSGRYRGSNAHHATRPPRPCDPKAPCPIMRTCGGCEWLNLPYRKQLARKQRTMEELFTPVIERFGWNTELDDVRGMGGCAGDASPMSPRAFRHKAATPFAPGRHGNVLCGFFARGTHDIVPVETCVVEAPGARAILNGVARVAEELGIPAYDEDAHRGILRYAVVRMGWKTDEAMLTVVTSTRDIPRAGAFARRLLELDPRIRGIAQNVNPKTTNAILGARTYPLAGSQTMRDSLLGCTFEISPTAFYQTNPEQTETLYRLAIEGMDLQEGDVVLDAYCGSGTIGLCAAHDARERGMDIELIGVERNTSGIRDARRNALLNDLGPRARFIADDATSYMRRAALEGDGIQVLCMDPPRAGSTAEFIQAACALAPRRIVYVSCNPLTQVRDIEQFAQAGYRMIRLSPVDMFPHTAHVETVAVLETF